MLHIKLMENISYIMVRVTTLVYTQNPIVRSTVYIFTSYSLKATTINWSEVTSLRALTAVLMSMTKSPWTNSNKSVDIKLWNMTTDI